MNRRLFIGLMAALSWAPLEALVHLARPIAPLQVAALALSGAFVVIWLADAVRAKRLTRPWCCPDKSPATFLGLAAAGAWGVQFASGAFVWTSSSSAWLAIALVALGPLSLTAWAWQMGARNWVFILAAGAVLMGGRLI